MIISLLKSECERNKKMKKMLASRSCLLKMTIFERESDSMEQRIYTKSTYMIIAGAHNAAVLDMCVLVCVQEHPKCIIYICVHEVWYSVRSLYRWNRPFERNENYLFDCFVDFTACRVAV